MMQHHKYSLTELENMIPWERDIYVSMLIAYIETENQKIAERQRKRQMDKNKLSKKDTEKIIEQQTGIISSLIDKLKEQNSKESKNKYKKSEGPSLPKFLKSKQFKP